MVFCFTATGNSLYIAKQLENELVSIPQIINNTDLTFEVKNKDFYYIVTAADAELESAETTIQCFRGYADCVEGAKEMGIIYGMGVYEKGEIKNTHAMVDAYNMGKSV